MVAVKSWRDTIQKIPETTPKPWRESIQREMRDGRHGKDGRDGADGKDGINGKNGKDGKSHQWYIFESGVDDSIGNSGDLAIEPKSCNFYQKKNGKWVLKGCLRGKAGLTVFGGKGEKGDKGDSGSGGSGGYLAATTAIDLTITTQTFVSVTGAGPVTISLMNPSLETKTVTVFNDSAANVTVNVATGQNILSDTSFIITPGSSYIFSPQGVKYYVS